MTGTFGGALEARQIDASNGKLSAEVRGEIGKEKNVLVIRRIHVVYRLKAPASARETVERVHEVHQKSCPVYMSLYKGIDITTECRMED
ncbi:OsmC family protein [Desulfuromonas versatilis]|uniref:OsmC family protein n=1 Tax=Desulfuromonas versatilis TaxID=2802975 RepID=UPI001C854C44|nr:OsmC family protein [Desulfuromonas versatilis]